MRCRLIASLSVEDRLRGASDFLAAFAQEEILLIAPTRTAADELVRSYAESNGAFGVHRFTLAQLAFLLAAERLARDGKSFATGAAMDAMAARAVQDCRTAGDLKWFEPVATTPGFFRALAATINELRLNNIDSAVIRPVGPSGRDLSNLLRRFDQNLQDAGVADLAAAFKTATAVINEPDFRFRGRPVVFLDVIPTSFLEGEMIRSLAQAASSVLATAHQRDRSSIGIFQGALGVEAELLPAVQTDRAMDRLRMHVFELTAPSGEMDASIHFVSATDEGRESVEMARSILALAQSRVPFDRMAIVLRTPDVYQPAVEDALRRAGIPAYFSLGSRRPNPAGRALLALLACASEGLSASRFSEYLSLGQVPRVDKAGKPAPKPPQWIPVQGELFPEIVTPAVVESPAPDEKEDENEDDSSPVISGSLRTPYQWERLLVDAAVIGGHDRWVRRLNGLANELRKQIEEADTERESTVQQERQLERLANLRNFAIPVITFLDGLPERGTWDAWLDALKELAVLAIRGPEFVISVLDELRPMGSLGPITLDEVREVLTHRLTFLRTEGPERRYGKVFVTTAAELAGLSFDVVFLPGLAEDNFPKKVFEDPLLLDDARQTIGSGLPTQSARIAQERLLLHIAVGGARSKLWISYPRMDLGQGRARNPSFYALDVLRAVTGRVPSLAELLRRSAAHTQSQIGWPAPRNAVDAIDDAEYDLAIISGLTRAPLEEATGRARYLVTSNANLARSLRARSGRWKRKWTEGDGIVASDAVIAALSAHRLTARPYSATALQHFAACPYRFALYAIHRIQARTETVAIERMDALTRGSLFHATQFQLLSGLRDLKLLPIQSENLASVIPIADRVFDEVAERYREELAPAIPRIWESQIEDIRWDFRGWLREMSQPGNALWTPEWFELSFGLPKSREKDPASQPKPVELPSGIRVRGAIDMIEERDGVLRITDHKTGRALARHPGMTGNGEVLQPVLYAVAAEILLGKQAESGRLFYCTERGGYQTLEIRIDEHSREALATILRLIDRSILEGFLPAAPREGACTYCDYRPVCGPYEETRIRRKGAAGLAVLNELRKTP